MSNLPNVDLRDISISHDKYFSQGYESIIYGPFDDSLVKLFRDDIDRMSIGVMFQNKLDKIRFLYEANIPYLIKPLYTVSSNGVFIGYGMEYDSNFVAFNDVTMRRKEKIAFLKRTAEILRYFKECDITYGDIMGRNILVNRIDGSIKFCDVDNIRIGNNGIDNMNGCLGYFSNNGGFIGENGDSFMHNLFTLRELYYPNQSLSSVLRCVVDCNLKHSFNKNVRRIEDEMSQPNYFQGDYIIQYIKR